MPGPSVGTIVICDRNAQSRNQEWFVRWPSQPLLAGCSSVTLEGPEVARPWGDPTDLAFIELAHEATCRGRQHRAGQHDPILREALIRALPGVGVEMLLGVRSADALALARRGVPARIYVPRGED